MVPHGHAESMRHAPTVARALTAVGAREMEGALAHPSRRTPDDPTRPRLARPAHPRALHPRGVRRRGRTAEAPAVHADPRLRAHWRVRAALHGAREGLVQGRGPRREDRA